MAADAGWGRAISAWRDKPDVVVIAAWAAIAGILAWLRASYAGDGIRHIAPILANSRPSLGEPRWLLFPAFLFAAIKPLQLAGVVASSRDAVRVFVAIDFAAGAAYLLLLRRWLIARSADSMHRAAALLLAGMTVPMLRFATDTIEAIVPATIALGGIVYLATRREDEETQGLIVAGASIAAATLLYQGLILAAALVPCAAEKVRRPRIGAVAIFCAMLAAAPAVMFAAMVVTGSSSPRESVHRMTTGERNPLARQQMRRKLATWPEWMPYAAAATIGPARSIVTMPRGHGITEGTRLLKSRTTFFEGALALSSQVFALALIAAGTVSTLRRREWRTLAAAAGILILPIVRSFSYTYLKFFVLVPAVVALVAASAPTVAVFGAGAIVGAINLKHLADETAADRRLARDLAPIYQGAGASACWLTTGWGPPIFGWPGTECSLNQELARGRTEQLETTIAENNRALVDSFRRCFCEASAVYTDDVADATKGVVNQLAQDYRFGGFDLNELLWQPRRGEVVLNRDALTVSRYSAEAQAEICGKLRAAGANAPSLRD